MTEAEEIQIVWLRREAEARRIRIMRAGIVALAAILTVAALTYLTWR